MTQPAASPRPGDTLDHPTAPADRRWMILAVVAVAQLMAVLDSTIPDFKHVSCVTLP